MPLNLQTKLLRVLEEDTIRRVSGKVELLKVSYETLGY
jgi:DNA-binding NtrC family response regulator